MGKDTYKKDKVLSSSMKLGLILLLSLFIISFASAEQQTLGTFKQGDCIELTQICGDCTFNTLLSVQFPDGSKDIIQQNMTQNGADFNFTYCNTSQIGSYNVNGVGDLSQMDTAWAYNFFINPTGDQFDDLRMNFAILFILAAASFTMIYKFNESRQTIAGQDGNFVFYYLGAFMLFGIGVYTIINGFGGYVTVVTQAFGYIMWGSALYFLTKPWFTGSNWKW